MHGRRLSVTLRCDAVPSGWLVASQGHRDLDLDAAGAHGERHAHMSEVAQRGSKDEGGRLLRRSVAAVKAS